MKKTIFALALLGIVLIDLSSCKKSDSSSNPSGQFMTASMTGNQNFSANNFVGANSASLGALNLLGFKISGADTLAMWIYIPDTLSVGEPGPVVGGEYIQYGSYQTSGGYAPTSLQWEENDQAGPGSLTVTAWDTTKHTISGTFWGTVYDWSTGDSLVMANGKFNVNYTNVP